MQCDTCEISLGLYHYTAIDDCTRFKVVALYPAKSAANSLDFLENVKKEVPFPIQRVQTDRGMEFFAYDFQQRLMDYAIKFRPIKPRSPPQQRPHSGRYCYGKTPMQTFSESKHLAEAKMLDRQQVMVGQHDEQPAVS